MLIHHQAETQPDNHMSATTYLPSISNVATVTVQESIVAFLSTAPLPTNYWTRPINAMNYNWFSIAGNWLGGPNGIYRLDSQYNPYTIAPNSAHILWTKPESFGGTVGGDFGSDLTGNYYTTDNTKTIPTNHH